jgi:hypothetical protein
MQASLAGARCQRAGKRHDHRIQATPVHLTAADDGLLGDDPARYEFRFSGRLGPTLLTAFPALVPREQGTETVLAGLLPDAAALYRVLAEMEVFGLDLLQAKDPAAGGVRVNRRDLRAQRAGESMRPTMRSAS